MLSPGHAQEMVSFSQGETSYKAKVKSFKQKMMTMRKGQRVTLKTFEVEGIRLRMDLYPNGSSSDDPGYVSIYVKSFADVDVKLLLDIKIGDQEIVTDFVLYLKHNQNPCGFPEFYSHDNLYYSSEDETDDDYEITLTVKKLWKEYKEDAVDGNVIQTLTRLDTKMVNNNKQLLYRLEELERSMESLQLQGCIPDKKPQIPYPECPICLEDMTQDSRIMQCSAGHLICGGCHDRMEAKRCPSCKKPIIGRCHGMETYLRSLFPKKETPTTNNDRVYLCY